MRGGESIALNRTRRAILGDRVRTAAGFLGRLVGLLGTRSLPRGGGLWISPCDGVHTLGMRYPIDVLFLDGDGVVVGCCRSLRPWRFSPRFRNARGAIELPAGTLARTGTGPGDRVELGRPAGEGAP